MGKDAATHHKNVLFRFFFLSMKTRVNDLMGRDFIKQTKYPNNHQEPLTLRKVGLRET